MVRIGKGPQDLQIAPLVLGFQVVDAGSGQDVLSKSLDVVKARVSLAKTGQHVAGALRLSTLEFLPNSLASWVLIKR